MQQNGFSLEGRTLGLGVVNDMKDSFGEYPNPFLEVKQNFRTYRNSEVNSFFFKLKKHELLCFIGQPTEPHIAF